VGMTFTDLFCGAGGSSVGLAAVGFELKLAANHWDRHLLTAPSLAQSRVGASFGDSSRKESP
jgi:site-specific DNA-cytosine methylase